MMLTETCWVEIDLCNGQKHIFVGCIYKHPSASIDEFKICLEVTIKRYREKYESQILGDSIDFKYSGHSQQKIIERIMLYSNSFLHVIVKTTRTTACATMLIDHIHTNTTCLLYTSPSPRDAQ